MAVGTLHELIETTMGTVAILMPNFATAANATGFLDSIGRLQFLVKNKALKEFDNAEP